MNTAPATRSNSTRQPLVPSRPPPMAPPNFTKREREFADHIMEIFYKDSTDLYEWNWVKRAFIKFPHIKEYIQNMDDTWVRSMSRKVDQKIESLMNVARNDDFMDENYMEGDGVQKNMQMDFCVSCKKKTEGTNFTEFTAKNGRKMRKSKCVECSGGKCSTMKSS
jgi:hypothetical protein